MELYEILSVISKAGDLASSLKGAFKLAPEDPLYIRRAIFVASAAKLSELARALQLLADSDLYEEAVGLARVMVEVVINAIYLQFTEEDEVNVFMRFDSLKISCYLANKATVNGDSNAAEANRCEASRIASAINRTGKEFSWCKNSLSQRAVTVDQVASTKVFVLLQENSSILGNLPLHGSFVSMMHLMPHHHEAWPHRENFCKEAAHLVLNALRGFAEFADQFFEISPEQPPGHIA